MVEKIDLTLIWKCTQLSMLLPFLMITIQIKPYPNYAREIWVFCFSCFLRHTSTCALTRPRVNKGYIFIFSFYLKTEVSTWRRVKRSPLILRLRNLRTQRSSVIFDLCLNRTRAGKPHGYRDIIVFEKLWFENIFRPNSWVPELLMMLYLQVIRHDKRSNHKASGVVNQITRNKIK